MNNLRRTGPKIPRNRKERYCPRCGQTMVKSGILRKKQMWKCRGKECRFATAYPNTEMREG